MFDYRNQVWGQEPTQIAMVVTVVVVGGEGRETTDEDDGVARTNYGLDVFGTKVLVAVVEERGDEESWDGAEVEGDGRDSEDRRDGEEALCEADQ